MTDEVIIGLEVHCQLKTQSKLFCGCSTDYRDDGPNTHVCPTCLGLPGALPTINKRAVESALMVAKALSCHVNEVSEFSRKNYFYPDLAKSYQITQYDRPLAERGLLEIEGEGGGGKKIRITRVHIEEDPGRLVHKGTEERVQYSLVDYNRSGIPLIEIVSEPDLRSPKEAREFLNKLRATLDYLTVWESEREGSLRVDANISYTGSSRVEIKNITSYRGVEKALRFEMTRQKNLIRRGQRVERETRHYIESRGVTQSARSKEGEEEYRYFPEPDLPPIRVKDWIERIRLPELPDARRARFVREYRCSQSHARTLTGDPHVADFYESLVARGLDTALAATWIADTLLGELHYRSISLSSIDPERFASLIDLVARECVTPTNGVEILRIMLDQTLKGQKEGPESIVERLGLQKARGTESDALTELIRETLRENEGAIQDYQSGRVNALNFLLGQVMRKTKGRADPRDLTKLLIEMLSEYRSPEE